MGTDTTFSAAVAAIVAHHAKLYNLLLAALPAYSGGRTPPQKQFYTLCIIDGMNIASIFVIAQYCRPKSLREAPK